MYIEIISYLCTQIEGESSHKLNLKTLRTMTYLPIFITNSELERVGVTAEQICKIFHREYDDAIINTEISPSGINVMIWQDPNTDNTFTREYAQSFN